MLLFAESSFALVEPYIIAYGAAALFVFVYFESFGAPLPGETAVIAGSLLAVHGDLSIVAVYFAVLFAGILGDSTGYVIGRFGGQLLLRRFGPWVKLTPDRLEILEKQFREKGPYLVLIARFIPLMRQLNGLIAGSMAMPWHIFLAANAAGCVLWTSVWVLGPYFFSHLFAGWHGHGVH
jgi:membrane protein DedA with SNARE-associated domain